MFIISILILWLLIKLNAPILFLVLGCITVTTELIYTINDIIATVVILLEARNENRNE